MQAVACPQCGAPIQGPVSGPIYLCPYCRQTSKSHAPPPPPQFVIIQPQMQAPPPSPSFAPQRRSRPVLLPALLPLAIVALVMGLTFRSQLRDLTGIGAWSGGEPLVCDGNDDINVSGVSATFNQGSAIVVRGNCHVTMRDCTIKAPVAIDASSNGHVTFINGVVQGTVEASGNATIDLLGNVKSIGTTKRSGNARISGK